MSGALVNSFATFGTGTPSSTITPLGTVGTSTTTSGTVTMTTSVDVSAGETVVVAANWRGNQSPTSIDDGTANAYTEGQLVVSDVSSGIYYILSPLAIPSGTTITLTLDGNSASKSLMAFKLNVTAAFLDGGEANGNSATPSAATAGSVATDKAMFGASCQQGNNAYTQPGGNWVSDLAGSIGDSDHAIAHGVTQSAGVTTYDPTMAGIQKWSCVVAAFG